MGDSISEEEYALWVAPAAAIHQLGQHTHANYVQQELWRRLRFGELRAASQTARYRDYGGSPTDHRFVLISKDLWRGSEEPNYYDALWQFGTYEFSPEPPRKEVLTIECVGIRFDPLGIARLMEAMGAATLIPEATNPEPLKKEIAPVLRSLGRADAERFATAILTGWPEATEDFAHAKAILFFPENKVPRDWFRGIFRVIRGPRKRGVQPKNRS